MTILSEMRLRTIILLLSFPVCGILHAQQAESIDTLSLRRAVMGEEVKQYDGGYLLDMNTILQREAPVLPRFTLQIPDATQDLSFLYNTPSKGQQKDYNRLFALPSGQSYGTATYSSGYGFWNSGHTTLQSNTYQLNNGMRITTYGLYNKEGWRMPSHSALPWERNMYKGAFELKSSNGAFGIRFEVERH